MNYEETKLKAYKEKIEIVELTIDIPIYNNLEDRSLYGTYEGTLLKLFNNKRENKEDILEIRNYYGNNKITLVVNLTNYSNGSNYDESIKHLKEWLRGSFDMKLEDIKEYKHSGYLYTINTYENNIDSCDDYVKAVNW